MTVKTLVSPSVAALQPYVPGKPIDELAREIGFAECAIIKLASNESPLGPSPAALAAITGALTYSDLGRYPDGNGFALKKALSTHTGCSAECITLGNGSNDVLIQIAQAFIHPGDVAWYSDHAFAIYRLAVQQVGGAGVAIPATDYAHNLAHFQLAFSNSVPKVIFLANPNNPTGTWFTRSALVNLLEVTPETTLVVLDEAYCEYIEDPEYPDGIALLSHYPNLIVTRTFSKAYGLAGLRVGYAVSSPEIADYLNRVRQPFNVNTLGLLAAEHCLSDKTHLQKAIELNRQELAKMTTWAQRQGMSYIESNANFLTLELEQPAQVIFEKLLKKGVIVRPLQDYGMPNHLRVSIGLARENDSFCKRFENELTSMPGAE